MLKRTLAKRQIPSSASPMAEASGSLASGKNAMRVITSRD